MLAMVITGITILVGMTGCIPKLTEQEEKCVSAIEVLKKDLKDETSLRLYDEVYAVHFSKSGATIYCVTYDAKNGFGAYNGKTQAEIVIADDDTIEPFYVTKESKMFLGVRNGLVKSFLNRRTDIDIDVEIVKIELDNICKYLKAELIK